MTDLNRSPLAIQVADQVSDRERESSVFGLAVHTSGSGIVAKALALKRDIVTYVVEYYTKAKYSCHYIVGYDGQIFQVSADDRRVPHIGVSALERDLYLSGNWIRDPRLSSETIKLWQARWHARKSPSHLYPDPFPNQSYVGCELPPLPAEERGPGDLWYTDEQHIAVAELANDLRRRHSWPEWPAKIPCSRLLGHEDVDLFGRSEKSGGWDPGSLRSRPRFDWSLVRRRLAI